MKAQPLTTYEERLKQYRKEIVSAVLFQMLIGLPICFGMLWLVSATMPDVLPIQWWALAPGVWLILVVPPVMKSLPLQPRPDDVEHDKALRRTLGVSD